MDGKQLTLFDNNPDIFQEKYISGEICSYCNKQTQFVDSSIIYNKSYGMIYYCKKCDAYVGVHKHNNKALGRVANKELRDHKIKTHYYFDALWKKAIQNGRSQHEARSSAYKWLSKELGIPKKYCHIGMFNIKLCEITVQLCKPYLDEI